MKILCFFGCEFTLNLNNKNNNYYKYAAAAAAVAVAVAAVAPAPPAETHGEEAEAQHVVDAQRLQLQDDGGQVGPLHLWHGGGRQLLKVLLWRRSSRRRTMEVRGGAAGE